ncbi:hypothetical protein G6M50_05925 [Agrobacterium rhizogenes]|nr:hypothetical protein [Rhizobium rhizogenes]NTJ77340.1 hypothetical protein [Rhizobium rhizogenes]
MKRPTIPTIVKVDIPIVCYNADHYQRNEASIMTYEELYEHDGTRWIMGRTILKDIVNHVKGKPLVANYDVEKPTVLNIEIPLPEVRDAISGEMVSILYMVPPELIDIVVNRLNEAMAAYLGETGKQMLDRYLASPMTLATVTWVKSELFQFERGRQGIGIGELWQVVAEYVGLQSMVQQPFHIAYEATETNG